MRNVELPGASVELNENIADTAPPVEETVDRRMAIGRMFAGIKGRELKILTMLGEGYTTAEIGKELGLKASYARELIAAVRAKARGFMGEL